MPPCDEVQPCAYAVAPPPRHTDQAVTAASMADTFNDVPAEGDGFTYEFLDERKEVGTRAGVKPSAHEGPLYMYMLALCFSRVNIVYVYVGFGG